MSLKLRVVNSAVIKVWDAKIMGSKIKQIRILENFNTYGIGRI
jgi:hypothetical protein